MSVCVCVLFIRVVFTEVHSSEQVVYSSTLYLYINLNIYRAMSVSVFVCPVYTSTSLIDVVFLE